MAHVCRVSCVVCRVPFAHAMLCGDGRVDEPLGKCCSSYTVAATHMYNVGVKLALVCSGLGGSQDLNYCLATIQAVSCAHQTQRHPTPHVASQLCTDIAAGFFPSIDCLLRNLEELSKDCSTEVMHLAKLRQRDFRFNPDIVQYCRYEIMQVCYP